MSVDVTTCTRTWTIQRVCCLQRCSVHCSRRGRSYPGRTADTCRIASTVEAQEGLVRTDDRGGSEGAEEHFRTRCREQGSKAGYSATGLSTKGCVLGVPRCRVQGRAAPSVLECACRERDIPHRYPLSCPSPSPCHHLMGTLSPQGAFRCPPLLLEHLEVEERPVNWHVTIRRQIIPKQLYVFLYLFVYQSCQIKEYSFKY